MRTATIERNTAETKITCTLNLDGTGRGAVDTGCGFLDHMLQLFSRHGRLDLDLVCSGDVWVDDHHTVEDVGIVLGRALSKALADRAGILRYGQWLLPMDEALVLCALDISGRGLLCYDIPFATEKIGDFDTQLVGEFFMAFAREAGLTLHLRRLAGANSHHVAEAAFKGCARALAAAVAIDPAAPGDIPSTKGTIL